MAEALLALFLLIPRASGHEGPPYQILSGQKLDSGELAVWADPDVGEGTFILLLQTRHPAPAARAAIFVESAGVWTEHAAAPDPEVSRQSGKTAFVGKVPFSHEGIWRVGFGVGDVLKPSGIVDVEVTPPGPTRSEFLIYFMPFVLMGALWVLHAWKRRAAR